MTQSRLVLLATLVVTACAPLPPKAADAQAALKPPAGTVQRNVTNFSDAMRCMDKLYIDYAVRDVSVVLEDLSDSTKKVSAGTRDMMMSAISDQSRRSRAIEVSVFGADANNAVAFMANAQKRSAFAVVPRFNLRGSITQLDEGVIKRQSDAGLSLSSLFGAGTSTSKQFNVMGLDVAMADTARLTLVPGVVSKNLTTITKEGEALDAQATFTKVGINFSTSLQRSEGTAQALRNMVELSSVELFGRLLKLPYWSCLGADASNAEIANEIEDWFVGMDRGGELTPYFQTQLRNRGFFDGPANGNVTPALLQAVSAYRVASGMGDKALVDLPFFTKFLSSPFPPPPPQPFRDVVAVAPVATPAATAATTPAAARIGLSLTPGPAGSAKDGLSFSVATTAPAYVYCYAQTAGGKLQRIFPNRFVDDPMVEPAAPLLLPGKQGFKLLPGESGSVPVACFAAPREIYKDIPTALRWGDFQDLNAISGFSDIRELLEKVAKEPVAAANMVLKKAR